MILYKYRSLENFEHVSDLLLTKRLYCPKPSELNDPLEGVIGIDISDSLEGLSSNEKWNESFKFWLKHDEKVNSYRVCAFSGNPESILMWSYYGAGHSGMCLELDLEEYRSNIHKVKYISDFKQIDRSSVLDLLTHKLNAWLHEDEYRWISHLNERAKYLRADIKTVLIGAGIDMKYIRPVLEMCALMEHQIDIVSFNTSGEFHRFPLKKGARWDDLA